MSRIGFTVLMAALVLGCGPDGDNNGGSSNNGASNNGASNNGASNNGGATNNGQTTDTSGGTTSAGTNLEQCAGDYIGTFMGDDVGAVAATLDADGTLTVTFSTSVGPTNATGTVTEAGDVSGSRDGTSVTGTLDFDDCTMSGDWTTTGFGGGTWQASKS